MGLRLDFGVPVRWMLGALLMFAAGSAGRAEEAPQREESWQVVYLSGQRVGHGQTVIEPVVVDGKPGIRTQLEMFIVMKRFGQVLSLATKLVTHETLEGDLKTFQHETRNPPNSVSQMSGEVAGELLKISNEVNGRITKSESRWKLGVKSPAYQDRLLKGSPMKPGDERTFEAFFPEMNRVATVVVKAGDVEETALANGSKARLQRFKVTNSLLPGIVTTAWASEKGDSVKSSTTMLGTDMVTYTVTKEEALKAVSSAELDLGIKTLVKTAEIPNPYGTKRVVYKVTLPDADPSTIFPKGDSQTVEALLPTSCRITVTALPVATGSAAGAVPEDYLKPTPFLQSDDPNVVAHAEQAAGNLKDPAEVARAMEKYVRDRLTSKNFSTALASAGEVAKTLSGDCTEHAVLLAAMLRVRQIPSRVAVGMVYINNPPAFGGHMWTEAWLGGKWVPLDATLGRGGIGGTHLKMGDANLGADNSTAEAAFTPLLNVIGNMKLEVESAE